MSNLAQITDVRITHGNLLEALVETEEFIHFQNHISVRDLTADLENYRKWVKEDRSDFSPHIRVYADLTLVEVEDFNFESYFLQDEVKREIMDEISNQFKKSHPDNENLENLSYSELKEIFYHGVERHAANSALKQQIRFLLRNPELTHYKEFSVDDFIKGPLTEYALLLYGLNHKKAKDPNAFIHPPLNAQQ